MKNLTNDNYQDFIKEGLVIVEFGANWCGDCRRIAPIMQVLEEEYKNIRFYEVNFSNEESLKDVLEIKRIPTLIFYKNGVEVGTRLVEPKSRLEIENEIQNLISK